MSSTSSILGLILFLLIASSALADTESDTVEIDYNFCHISATDNNDGTTNFKLHAWLYGHVNSIICVCVEDLGNLPTFFVDKVATIKNQNLIVNNNVRIDEYQTAYFYWMLLKEVVSDLWRSMA